ncbi:heme-binding domain-containing protein [soil metagenome]|jgi:hypothetical protein
MKRIFKIVLLLLLVVFILLQLIPRYRNEGKQAAINDITKICPVPGNVQALLKNSCYDCHSNHTAYPWYAQIQPMGYMLDNHVKLGKEDLNFNEFGAYSKRKQSHKLRAIATSMTEGTMPLSSYLFIHRSASLSPADKSVIVNWANKVDIAY